MVQFSLPQNSKILKGKYHKDKTGSNNLKKVNLRTLNSFLEEKTKNTFIFDITVFKASGVCA